MVWYGMVFYTLIVSNEQRTVPEELFLHVSVNYLFLTEVVEVQGFFRTAFNTINFTSEAKVKMHLGYTVGLFWLLDTS
jgi:hypothetical protein